MTEPVTQILFSARVARASSTNFPFKAVTSPPVRYFPFQSLRLIPLSCRPFENKKNASAPETRRRPPLQAPPPREGLDLVVDRCINKRWQFLCNGSLLVPGRCLVHMAYAECCLNI